MAARKKTVSSKASKLSAAEIAPPEGVLTRVALDQIDPESFENQRTGDFTKGDSDESGVGSSFKELWTSIEETGQKDPITVRRKAKGRHGLKVPFEIVKGFRRYAAVKFIADKNQIRHPDILVIIKDLTDVQALEENIFENTARDNLTGPDLAWAAYKLSATYAAGGGPTISGNAIAARMGKNQSYISKLMRIVETDPVVAQKWREAAAPISIEAIERISKLKVGNRDATAEERLAEYEKISLAKPAGGKKGPGGKTQVEIATSSAVRTASLLGRLQRAGFVAWGDNSWKDALEALGVKVSELTPPEIKAVAKAAKEAFAEALKEPEVEESEESEDAA